MPQRVATTTVLLLLLALLLSGAAQAATTFVPNRFDDPVSGGTSCGPPAAPNGCSLRGALAAAQDGDTISLGAGTYTLSHPQLDVTHNVAFTGAGPAATTINQTVQDRVLTSESNEVVSITGRCRTKRGRTRSSCRPRASPSVATA